MQRRLIGLGLTAALLLACGPALASWRVRSDDWFWRYYDEKWCLSAMTELVECSYATFRQCDIARQGVGGSCSINPRYVERGPKRTSRKRAYR